MPEASTKKRVWKQGPILHEMMFRLHETTVSMSASKLSKITKWVSKAGFFVMKVQILGGPGGATVAWRSRGGGVEVAWR